MKPSLKESKVMNKNIFIFYNVLNQFCFTTCKIELDITSWGAEWLKTLKIIKL